MKKENPAPARDRQPTSTPCEGPKSLRLNLEALHGGALVLHCEGKLIYQNEARQLAAIVTEVLPTARRMVVDLSGVKAVDSAGLGELVLTHLWAEAAGFELKLASPNRTVRYLLELTNLVSVLDVYASVPEAMAALDQEELRLA